jgi:hypothetical protein
METVSQNKTVYAVSSGKITIRASGSQMRNADFVETFTGRIPLLFGIQSIEQQ